MQPPRPDQTWRAASVATTLVTWLSMALLAAFAIGQLAPPPVVPASDPPEQFSAVRALPHVEAIAQLPHPIGTEAHAAARAYLAQQAKLLGLETQVQEVTVIGRSATTAATVHNVVARLAGSNSTGAILLAAHYDSVGEGPGASDDGAGVAALLETARALQVGPPLQNDVIFLFTDSEETGLLGAKAFTDEHPWAQDVAFVVNLEARGHTGPTLLFETSQGNGALIEQFVSVLPAPQTSSLFFEVYQMLPNDTDFSVFKRAGMSGFNLAFMNGPTHYHSALDTVQNLEPRSLQHHGSTALALARAAGNQPIPRETRPNAVYFSLLGETVVHYGSGVALLLTAVALLGWLGLAAVGVRRGLLTRRGIALGAGLLLASLLATFALVALLWFLVRLALPAYRWLPSGEPYNGSWIVGGFALLTIGLVAALYRWGSERARVFELAMGALLWWAVLALVATLALPGASYFFTWPLLFALLGVALLLRAPALAAQPWSRVAVLVLTALPSILLLAPTLALTSVALLTEQVAVTMTILALVLGLLVPHLYEGNVLPRWLLPVGGGLLGLLLLLGTGLTTPVDAAHPRPTSLFYALDAESGGAQWASASPSLDEWTSQYLPDATSAAMPSFFPTSRQTFWQGTAPVAPLEPPLATVESDTPDGETRLLRLRLQSPRGAPLLFVSIDGSTPVLEATLNDKMLLERRPDGEAVARPRPWSFRYYGLPSEGIELLLRVPRDQPVPLQLVDLSLGLPTLPDSALPPMPEHMMSAPFTYGNVTLVRQSYPIPTP